MKKIYLPILLLSMLTFSAGCANQRSTTTTPKLTKTDTYLTYLKSTEDSLPYCNGADMDSEGYKKTITDLVTTNVTTTNMTQGELAKATVLAATSGMCNDALKKTDIRVNGDIVYIGKIGTWAGVSIVMCSCRPEIEVNLLRLPGINNVVFE